MEEHEGRRRIIVAAIELANGQCLKQIDSHMLARHSGIEEELLQQLFPNRDALFNGIFQWASHHLMVLIEYAALRDNPPLEVLEDIFHIHVTFLEAYPSLPKLLLEALDLADDNTILLRRRMGKLLEDYDATLALLFHLARKERALRPDLEPAVAVKLFGYLIQSLIMRAVVGNIAEGDWQQEGRRLWQQYLASIRA